MKEGMSDIGIGSTCLHFGRPRSRWPCETARDELSVSWRSDNKSRLIKWLIGTRGSLPTLLARPCPGGTALAENVFSERQYPGEHQLRGVVHGAPSIDRVGRLDLRRGRGPGNHAVICPAK